MRAEPDVEPVVVVVRTLSSDVVRVLLSTRVAGPAVGRSEAVLAESTGSPISACRIRPLHCANPFPGSRRRR
jgi:hypothetical protein